MEILTDIKTEFFVKKYSILKKIHPNIFFIIILTSYVINVNAQLGFCNGNSGDPIFTENFGAGTTNVPLPVGTTSYAFANVQPNDGFYTVSNRTNWYGWHDIPDHTAGDTNGRSLVVNADFTAGEFYKTPINDLCENTTYEFSSWMINLMPANHPFCGTGIPINVKFEIWDNTNTNLLASGDTGNINSTATPNWQQYALVFQTLPGQTSIILKMLNNGVGGCGNDLAIDDIVFKSCGDAIVVNDINNNSEQFICEGNPSFSTTLTAIPDSSIFATHFYQWQQSADSINWTDILGETNSTFTTPALNSTMFYRVKVAEDAINLSNQFCNAISDIYEFGLVTLPDAPVSNGDLLVCVGSSSSISVTISAETTVNWYDEPIGGNLLLSGSNIYFPQTSGIYYAETETIKGGCLSLNRTPLIVDFLDIPIIQDESVSFCENSDITLHANTNIATATYLWSTGATTEEITVNIPGIYSVEVTNINCTVTKTIVLTEIEAPVLDKAISKGNDITVITSNTGNYLYSLNGNVYQTSNTFINIDGGLYTIYVKEGNGCGIDTIEYIHFFIPTFFTPNNDGINDNFELKGIEFYGTSEVIIYNRYGKLLKNSMNGSFSWDGTFNNKQMPTDDYWYRININGQQFNGHFTLKR